MKRALYEGVDGHRKEGREEPGTCVIDSEICELINKLYRENYSKLLAYALKRGLHPVAAEDIVQDTFYTAIKRPDKIKEHPNPEGWLMNTVKNKLLEFYRRTEELEPRDWAQWESDIIDLEDEYGVVELGLMIDSILSPAERRLFRMYFLQGYSAKELAEQEHITVNNLKVKMHRLRLKLEKEVRKQT